jgi:hypothetical protein
MSCISLAILARSAAAASATCWSRAVVQLGEVSAAGGGVKPEAQGGGDHAGHEDAVKPPRAARVPEQDSNGEEFEHDSAGQRVPARPQRCHGVQGDQQRQPVGQVPVPQPGGNDGGDEQAEHGDGPDPPHKQRRYRQRQHDNLHHGRAGAVTDKLWHC